MKVISFDSKFCQNLDQALKREWLETNQFGGFASSTVLSVNTRRQHSLLVVQLKPPLERHILLSSLEEILFIDDAVYPLSTQLYRDTIYPEGYLNLSEFSLLPFPTWIFRVEDLVLAKTVIFMHDEQTVLVRYQILEGDENLVRLELRPLTAFRHFQALTHKNERLNTKVGLSPGRIRFAGLFLHHNAAIVDQAGSWYCGVQYPEEREQGLDFEEDLYAPCRLIYTFVKGREVFFCASLENREVIETEALVSREQDRRYHLLEGIHVSDPRFQMLAYSGQAFFVNLNRLNDSSQFSKTLKQGSLRTAIIANYPWCKDSARDAIIALHGLTLTTGQYQIARQVLIHLAGQNGQWDDKAMDTPFWLIHRSFEYLKYSDDRETVEQVLFPVLNSIVERFIKGTQNGIHMTSDGLIEGVQIGKPLTWMNAKAGNTPVTLRAGKPVEVQALWYNALCAMALMSDLFGKPKLKKVYEELAQKVKRSFNQLFWDPSLGYLCDVIDSKMGKDISIRPNQLFALGLTFPVLEEEAVKWHSVLDCVKRHLLTPYGLRTLASSDPNYSKRCYGNGFQKAHSCHQGAIWPWFFIPFLVGSLRVENDPKQVKEHFLNFINPLFEHLEARGLWYISEMFDGDFPHEARGAIAHAANMGAVLELYEILVGRGTIFEKRDILTLRQPSI